MGREVKPAPPKRVAIIYNPLSGAHRVRDRAGEMTVFAGLLARRGVETTIEPTAAAGHAADLARMALAAGADCVVASGGDGTLNEVLQSVAGTGVPLAIYPAGTANVLARDLGLPREPELLAELVASGQTRRISCGRAGSRYFFLMAGIGLDAAIIRGVSPKLKKRWGKGAYAYSAARVLLKQPPQPFELEIDGRCYLAGFAVIGNSPSYGGGFQFTPDARLDDARFQVCLYPPRRRRLRYCGDLAAAWQAKPWRSAGVHCLAGHRVAARACDGGVPWVQVDGDLLGPLPMEFSAHAEAVLVIAPGAPMGGA